MRESIIIIIIIIKELARATKELISELEGSVYRRESMFQKMNMKTSLKESIVLIQILIIFQEINKIFLKI